MNVPEEIYMSVDRTYEATNGQIIGMVTTHNKRQSENDVRYILAEAANLDWEDVDAIRRIIAELDMSIESKNMTTVEFDSTVAFKFNGFKEKRRQEENYWHIMRDEEK